MATDTFDMYTFGWGEWGQCAIDSTDNAILTTPKLVESLLGKGVLKVASGWSHSVFVIGRLNCARCSFATQRTVSCAGFDLS